MGSVSKAGSVKYTVQPKVKSTIRQKATTKEITAIPMINQETIRVNANVEKDIESGTLTCPEAVNKTENTCTYIVQSHSSRIKDLMYRYNIPQEALTTGEAGEENGFEPEKKNFTHLRIDDAKGFLGNLHDKLFGSIVTINRKALEAPVFNYEAKRYNQFGEYPF